MCESPPAPPRYLRFVAALVLGSAAVVAPVAIAGCGDDGVPIPIEPDAAVDAPIDADNNVVDGPLHPPDLPRAARA
jgi:hypothetical protein